MIKHTFDELLRNKTDNISIQFFRSIFVGGLAAIVDFGFLYFFTEFVNIYYLTSAALAFILGLTTNYILSIKWVFNRRKFAKKWIEFGIFAVIGIVGLILNELIIWFFTEYVHFHYLLSKVVSTIVVFSWNFLARKFILFR
ncbi:GtrA family protein [candidate division WOR-3 bacterium]|nr:GtrA family protein [candidate division WOR-3 bacterium]